jgi:GDPmannose 4,6-dehydratase
MLQQDKPDDYVVATGETHSVREFTELAFREAGIDIEWEGEGVNEIGRDADSGKVLVEVDPMFYRPTKMTFYRRPQKPRETWEENKGQFEELVRMMVKMI